MATNEDEARFLAAILEQPEDDAPRLKYADWLVARGNPRGEFIRAQCALAGGVRGEARDRLRSIENKLLQAHQPTWFAWEGMNVHAIKRGFVEDIELSVEQFAKNGTTLLAKEPVRCLRLSNVTGKGLQQAFEVPGIERVTQLRLRGARFDAATMRVFATAEVLRGLKNLNFSGCNVSEDGVAALAECKQFDALETLTLTGTGVGTEGVLALTRTSFLARISALYLTACELDDGACVGLAECVHATSLMRLALAQNESIGNEGLKALATSPYLATLGYLELKGCGFGDAGMMALANSRELVSLRVLELGLEGKRVGAGTKAALTARYGTRVR